ncbi:MAG TPA: hypothetical protein VG253_09430 [Streptosporangiaceae bacterium]|nr:hypothetical protein [Streptosporangiaceae bacterium]
MLRAPRPSRRDRTGVDEPRNWRARPLIWTLTLVTVVAAVLFVGWLAWSIYVLVHGAPTHFGFDPDRRCATIGFSCGALSNFATSILLLALASAFLLWRLFALLRRYRTKAREESRELVSTAGTILDEIVGRDELCQVVMEDLHDRGTRPHVLVGGVGTGKTAVLVRLTELLAEKHAVPVPIRLRDAGNDLDFENMARERFLSEVNQRLFSSAEGETIWRRLRKDGKIVVLADGLEEALVGSSAEQDRDNIIRGAIRKAHQQHLPLVIASRPHDPLRSTEAAILALEPLSYEAALAYIGGDAAAEDKRRLAWIVETADVVEAPLYLQITRELYLKGLLERRSEGQDTAIDTRAVDRSQLRLGLLDTWEKALIYGHLREQVPLSPVERQAAIEHMSALACLGLMRDRLDIEFDQTESDLSYGRKISAEVQRRLAKLDGGSGPGPGVRNLDVRLAAAWAAQLELVELRGNSVRFPHSLMQAYLGSRLMGVAMQDPAYREAALQPPRPGREFLIALVLNSRATERAANWRPDLARREAWAGMWRARRLATPRARPEFVELLRQAAGTRSDNKVLDICAAALEIDCVAAQPVHSLLADDIKDRWPGIHGQDPRTIEEGKLALVRRFAEAVRTIDERRRGAGGCSAEPAYRHLYEISCGEQSYPVQHAIAQEIGAGGLAAYRALRSLLTAPGAEPSWAAADNDTWRSWVMSAWLAPLLVGSIGATDPRHADRALEEQAQNDLEQWLRHVGQDGRRPGEQDLPLSLEIALAQGFKYAANRRPAHPGARPEMRLYLAEQALNMLRGSRFWFSQLTLIQALCLLNLSDEPKRAGDKRAAKPEAIVGRWLNVAGSEAADRDRPQSGPAGLHPFVREAAELAVLVLKTGHPQRYCWIDESGVVAQVGSRNTGARSEHRRHHLWIPPSAGWTALNGRAQQLVADVLLLLNLAERGDQPRDRERRLKRAASAGLPPCITRYRHTLDPGRTVGTATSSAPGTSCVDGCAFELCPYPPKGVQPRVEMTEAFCRRQLRLLRKYRLGAGRAPWHEMATAQLTRFWAEMADRARGPRPGSAAGDQRRAQ